MSKVYLYYEALALDIDTIEEYDQLRGYIVQSDGLHDRDVPLVVSTFTYRDRITPDAPRVYRKAYHKDMIQDMIQEMVLKLRKDHPSVRINQSMFRFAWARCAT